MVSPTFPRRKISCTAAIPLVMRFARSAANIYGRSIISAESMAWAARPYSVTLDEMRKRTDLLISGGVNAETLHGYTYRLRDEAWPGWYAFQPNPFTTGFGSDARRTQSRLGGGAAAVRLYDTAECDHAPGRKRRARRNVLWRHRLLCRDRGRGPGDTGT